MAVAAVVLLWLLSWQLVVLRAVQPDDLAAETDLKSCVSYIKTDTAN